MGSMARDTVVKEGEGRANQPRSAAAQTSAGAPATTGGGSVSGPPRPPDRRNILDALRSALLAWSGRSARFLDYLSADPKRRSRAALVLAVALNTVLFTALAIFGRFQIWIPNAPGDTFSVVMVDLPPAPAPPEALEPEIAPEPEPEPIVEPEPTPEPEPEIFEQPEPEPAPAVEPEPAPPPEPEEIEPQPELDLTPAPIFAPPSEEGEAPLIPESEAAAPEDLGPATIEEEAPPVTVEEDLQTPAEEAPPLVEEIAEPEPELEGEKAEPEEEAAPEIAEPEPAGDDMFDEEPEFGRPRLPLPAVNLPEGQAAINPGSSGIVAIFCDQQFKNKDKAAECAGRTDIRSGWRPGASGEDWSQAARLLQQDRAAGKGGADPSAIYGASVGRRLEDEKRAEDLRDFRRGDAAINDPAGAASENLDATLGQPNVGPPAFEPSWTLREDPEVTQKDLKKLEKDLDEAEKKK